MKRSLPLLLCLCGLFFAGKVSCENTVITGQVLDQGKNPVASAIVALMKAKDSSLVKANFTDVNGNFSFEDLYEGKFILEISMPGHKTISRKFDVDEGEQKEMNSFVMESLKKNAEDESSPLLVSSNGKFLMDVEGSGKQIKGSAWEVMKTAPDVFENDLMWTFSKYQTEIYGMNINSTNHSFAGLSKIVVALSHNLEISVNGMYMSPNSNGYISTQASGTLNASVSKMMLNKTLQVEIFTNDILNTGSTSATILTQDGLIMYHINAETQNVSLKVKYVIGNEKAKREEK